ncbi:Antitoxin of toxin-antitoxin stability system [Vibrio nigripulchritudo MADA3029]|uniref:type II toxin-antitoxin system Phd/YefM family antitoxin n=1 Tax=Vibrio nigripulchritudo TaxID=28173 RepID=UPI0003B1A17C|nr:type II toxin-antitoxin system Phd/YefM family antitoxin [Vibrio nigripulchritudo]CCN50699.1 Antitoxin of toxin-antitoxin stability system [Vibrio nigripulchritudo MADA3020]CCN52270.1 Antitoxin of toxin-antitoxin stability system [Vibrio nigripulchritudo MADA3021]CCN59168.1 Antitoxin of toxin-antitoxin stability system [Vibrio nigripulchritudo MADA3029]
MKVELVTSLKRQATKILAELHDTKQPVLIIEHGKPLAYLVDVEDYEFMQNRLAILEGIARGERALADDKVVSHEEAKDKISKWLQKSARKVNRP